MSSFVFNDFKKRYLNGEVPSADEWSFIPVSDKFKEHFEFDDIRLDHYRTLSDFKDVSKVKKQNYFSYSGTELGAVNKDKARLVDVSANNFGLQGEDLLIGKKLTYKWTKVIDDEDLTNKPMFITEDNFENFKAYYSESIENNAYINTYLAKGGFYYIRSKDELEWFAEHSHTNDRIIGVMGDNIQGVIAKPIGYDEAVPFNGILDGNFYKFDIMIKANYTDNGIVGVLGPYGIVRNIKLIHTNLTSGDNSIDCENMPITLNHIKNDGRDINCGLLVGRNYGLVENIDASELKTFNIYGCVPSVYSVTNKSDDYKWNETENIVRKKFDDKNENFFYANSFCINSPGNICPYVGYFNEGKWMDDGATLLNDMGRLHFGNSQTARPSVHMFYYMANWGMYWNLSASQIGVVDTMGDFRGYGDNGIDPTFRLLSADITYETYDEITQQSETVHELGFQMNYFPLGCFWSEAPDRGIGDDGGKSTINSHELFTFELEKEKQRYLLNPLYYGMDNFGFFTVRGVGNGNYSGFSSYDVSDPQFRTQTASWVENYNSNLCQKALGNSGYRDNWNLEPSYEATRCSMRPHPMARAAYNIGVIIGANYGSAQLVQVSATVQNTTNFVGFIGGLAGKQAYGVIDNVSVYMDNQFNYQPANATRDEPSAGYVAYYKQTPILPDCVKTYLSAQLNQPQYLTEELNEAKSVLMETYCEPYYDNTRKENANKYAVNTAKVVTDDVIAYQLRPIFVVGGLFGRYVPTFGTNITPFQAENGGFYWNPLNTIVNNSVVLYKDNYNQTNLIRKRSENAFGAVVGKVDYSTVTDSIYLTASMALNNCKINAITEVGEPFRVFSNAFDTNINEWVPERSAVPGTNLSGLVSAMSYRRYVGVYEIKENVLDPVCYDTNSALTADFNGNVQSGGELVPTNKTKQSLGTMGIYWAGDYPIDLSSHNGGIEITHTMMGFQTPDEDYYFSAETDVEISAGLVRTVTSNNGPWDFRHVHYNAPNYEFPPTATGGWNRRNLATKLIIMNGCESNVDNWIQLYDDYMNNWNYMKLPAMTGADVPATDLSNDHLSSNTFDDKELYIIQKYWNRTRTNYGGWCPNFDKISASLHWDNTNYDFNKNAVYYVEGLLHDQIDPQVRMGTQNTFDGYSTVDIFTVAAYPFDREPYDSHYYIISGDTLTPKAASAHNSYISSTNQYIIPKTYKKNIMPHFNPTWAVIPNGNIEFETKSYMFDRPKEDTYFYYTYTTTTGESNNINSVYCNKENAFVFTLPVTFSAVRSLYGYTTPLTEDEINYPTYYSNISVGQYYTPVMIRDKINNSTLIDENNRQYFVSTSISSINNFGGLLVVDSSGHNVMFLDNEQKSQLTGNCVTFNTTTLIKSNPKTNFNERIGKIVLEVQ